MLHLLEGLKILQGLLSRDPQAGLHGTSEVADAGLEVHIQQGRARRQQHLHLLLQQHRLQEAQGVETHLPVSICWASTRHQADFVFFVCFPKFKHFQVLSIYF